MLGRTGVLVVAVVAAVLALNRDSSILDLVSFAWAGFGAAFGPIVLLSLYWRKLTSTGALAGMITGAVTVFVWGNIDVAARCHVRDRPRLPAEPPGCRVVSRATYKHNATIEEEFSAMENEIEENAPYVEVKPIA